mmetsp:Transcript_2145/g.8624  ORF Transcript_2145/g.8624 Transcript_2145/m.8624 type:complete len:248 (+) Transcript_2145:1462-2205(+)
MREEHRHRSHVLPDFGRVLQVRLPGGNDRGEEGGRDFELPGHQRVPHRDADGRLVHVRAVLVQVGAPPRQRRDVYVPRGAALGVRRRGHRAPGRMLVREGIHRLRRRHRRQEASRDKGSRPGDRPGSHVRLPQGVHGRRQAVRGRGRVQGWRLRGRSHDVLEHVRRARVRMRGGVLPDALPVVPRRRQVRGGQERVEPRYPRRRRVAVLRRRRRHRVRVVPMEAEVVHGPGDQGDHGAVHAARGGSR